MISKEIWEKNKPRCPSNDAGDCFVRGCISKCYYEVCPFVFWRKVEAAEELKAQLANIPKKKRFKPPEPRYDDIYYEGLEQLDKS